MSTLAEIFDDGARAEIDALIAARGLAGGVTFSLLGPGGDALDIARGVGDGTGTALSPSHWVEHASLSKTVAAVFATQYYAAKGVAPTASVNELLGALGEAKTGGFKLVPAAGCPQAWADGVQLKHLMNHTGLGMHYVYGVPLDVPFPPVLELITGQHDTGAGLGLGYAAIEVSKEPGTAFGYSGGGFLVLQHLLEATEGRPIEEVMRGWMDRVGLRDFSFVPTDLPGKGPYAQGFMDDGTVVGGGVGRLAFPPLAAGAVGTPRALANFWAALHGAYAAGPDGSSLGGADDAPISHATAASVLRDHTADAGSVEFMNAEMGLGVFVATAGPNKVALHQAANEGFRGAYVVVFEGPDAGKGMVVVSNGDNDSAILNAEVMRLVLLRWGWAGVDADVLRRDAAFAFKDIPQEQIVNQAYKALVFDAFEPVS